MRRTAVSLLALVLLFSVNLAQDEAPQGKEVDNAALLKEYLGAEGKEKAALKERLVALGVEDLQAAIAAFPFEDPEETGVLEFTTECPDGFERPFWVWIPDDYDATRAYPLLVCLHGGVGGWPLRGAQGRPPAGRMSIEYWRPNLPAEHDDVLILGCSAGVPETSEEAAWWHEAGQLNVLKMIREVKLRFNVDDNRVIVNGHSDGGSGSFGFAGRMPDTFAGCFSMNGNPLVPSADETPVWLENFKGQNIYCFNGGKDRLYPADQIIPLYEQANKTGAAIEFVNHTELGHGVGEVLADEVSKFMAGPVQEWRRNLLGDEIDWTTVSPARGERGWLRIDEITDLGELNFAPKNAKIEVPGRRVQLGVRLARDADAPTVESVVADTPAQKMGVKEGDVITKLDDSEIATLQDLADALGKKSPGDEVSLVVERDGEEKTLKGAFPDRDDEAREAPLTARVIAKLTKPGEIELKVRNAGKVSIMVTSGMLSEDERLVVHVNRGHETSGMIFEPVELDTALILEEFESTGDRKLPWVAKVEIDIVDLLNFEVPPDPEDEDEF